MGFIKYNIINIKPRLTVKSPVYCTLILVLFIKQIQSMKQEE